MNGGLAVRANLLCVTWAAARGYMLLFDLGSGRALAQFAVPGGWRGYSDAAGVAIDDRFQLFVADAVNGCVRRFNAFGRHLGDLGLPPARVSGAARDRLGCLSSPAAVAVHGDDVFVAGGDQPQRWAVQRFSRGGRALDRLRSCGDSEGEFAAPRGLHVDAEGILVADTLAGCVQRFRRDGRFIAGIALGAAARPTAVVRTQDRRILVVDRRREGRISACWPDGATAPAGALPAIVADPIALACDEAARIYVLDRGGERVLRFQPDLGFDRELVDLTGHLHALGT